MGESEIKDVKQGIVIEALPNTTFRVQLNDEENLVYAYLSGKMRIHHIKVLVGDKVLVKMDEHGEKGRIIKRL